MDTVQTHVSTLKVRTGAPGVWIDGVFHRLPPLRAEILSKLIGAAGSVVSHEQLLPGDRSTVLHVEIHRLRAILPWSHVIATEIGVGYCLRHRSLKELTQ